MLNLYLATGNVGREAGCMMITGQGNGQGGREHGQKADQLPGMRSIVDPEHRKACRPEYAWIPDSLPGPGLTAQEIMNAIHSGEIKALISMCFNPLVSLPDANFTREALSKLEFFAVIDFFLSETAHHADVVFAGSLQEEDEGVICSAEGRAEDQPGGGSSRRGALGRADHLRPRQAIGPRAVLRVPGHARDLRRAARRIEGWPRGLLRDYVAAHRRRARCVLAVPRDRPPGDAAPLRRRALPQGRKAHFQVTEWRESGDPVDASFPLLLTTGRVVSHYLSGTQTRRIGPLVEQYPEPKIEMHPRLAEGTPSSLVTGQRSRHGARRSWRR